MKNANNILFRCSSLGHLMVEPKEKAKQSQLSETVKTHLTDVFVSAKYGRNKDIVTKATNKGLMVEEDSITLFSLYTGELYLKNEERLKNEYIIGTPDLYKGESIANAELVIDVKSSWDIYTFFRAKTKGLNKMYYWQLQGYMALTGAKKAVLAYCLIDTPDILIGDAKRRLMYQMGVIDETTNKPYSDACDELDKLMTYSDIPMEERITTIDIEYNPTDIAKLYTRIEQCRKYMNENLFNL